jgi:hypothetical protein
MNHKKPGRVVSSKSEYADQRQYYIQQTDIAKVKTACQILESDRAKNEQNV